jgi:hypothetical protein
MLDVTETPNYKNGDVEMGFHRVIIGHRMTVVTVTYTAEISEKNWKMTDVTISIRNYRP